MVSVINFLYSTSFSSSSTIIRKHQEVDTTTSQILKVAPSSSQKNNLQGEYLSDEEKNDALQTVRNQLKNSILAKMKISILALASVQSLEMQIKDGSFVQVNGKPIIFWTNPSRPKLNRWKLTPSREQPSVKPC